MGKIEVIFEISLAYPVFHWLGAPQAPIVLPTLESGNTVYVEPPDTTQLANPTQGKYNTLRVRVERAGPRPRDGFWHQEHPFSEDAARGFFAVFNTLRYFYYEREFKVPGYPVFPATYIEQNPLVARCEIIHRYDGEVIETLQHGAIASIEISAKLWRDSQHHLSSKGEIPAYVGFALDAMYFAQFDPMRAIITANSAWETALRFYLANVASKKDPKFLQDSELERIPDLIRAVKEARGGQIFFDFPAPKEVRKSYRQLVCDLPTVRNRLVHRGITPSSSDTARDSAIAVLYAIDWLFEITRYELANSQVQDGDGI